MEFHHWHSGSLVRSLRHGCFEERVWEKVEGESEPWEKEAFFSSESLAWMTENTDDSEEKLELERIWQEMELAIGASEPPVDSKSCAWVVAGYYGFPGWD